MQTLSLDLGTHCGFAYGANGIDQAGTWTLATPAEIREWGKERLTRRQDPRPRRLYEKLVALPSVPELIVFEDVPFSSYALQCQLWSSLRTAVWLFGHFQSVRLMDCLGPNQLKKFATGHGGATKEMMCAALKKQTYLYQSGYDDNAIDAIWLWLWASKTFKRV